MKFVPKIEIFLAYHQSFKRPLFFKSKTIGTENNPPTMNDINAFSKTYPNACLSCKKLFTIISKIGFTTPLKMREVANQIQQHIIEYGECKSR